MFPSRTEIVELLRLKPAQPLVWAALCALAGILAAACIPLPWHWCLTVFVLLAGASLYRRRIVWFAIAAFFFFWHSLLVQESAGRKLAALAGPKSVPIHAQGVVDEEPSGTRFRVRLDWTELSGFPRQHTRAKVLVHWQGDLPAYGDRIEISGDLHPIPKPRNPGEFDAAAYRRCQGIYSEIGIRLAVNAKIIAHGCGNPVVSLANRVRHRMERTITLDLDDSPRIAALIQSIVLGSRAESLSDIKPLFQKTGTLHLYSVSGLNVAMLAAIVAGVLRISGVSRRSMVLILIPTLWGYAFITGLTSSCLRATVMATIALAGLAFDRPPLTWNSLGAAAFVVLLFDPNQLFLPGFQFSFFLVAILLAFAGRLQAWFYQFGEPDPFLPRLLWSRRLIGQRWAYRKIAGGLAVSLIAWAGSVPLTGFHYHLWSPSTILANLLALPEATAILALGIASAIGGCIWEWVAITLNNVNWLLAKILLAVITTLASLPGGHVYMAAPSLHRAPRCEVEVFDLSGGGAIHLRVRDGFTRRDWLFDCGSDYAFDSIVSQALHLQGVNRLDGFLVTHGDSQHMGGALDLLEQIPPTEIIDSPLKDHSRARKWLHEILAKNARGKSLVSRGDTVTLAPGVAIHILFPPFGFDARAADDKALVFRLDVGGRRILFTSDAGFSTEHWLLKNAKPEELSCDILVKGMHASDYSGAPEFLAAAKPQLVVSAGADYPPNRRIRSSWADMVTAQGITLFRQDRCGAVHIQLAADNQWEAETFLTHQRFRSSAR